MKKTIPPSEQVRKRVTAIQKKEEQFTGNTSKMISTGSTLLNLAISGTRVRGGGMPGGILVEIFGPSGTGKTVFLSEIAGEIQRQGGMVMFKDPEARLNKEFAEIFNLKVKDVDYSTPDTVPEVFTGVRSWDPKPEGVIHGIFADSLAALSTDMEMENKDQYGMRRAKEFSEEMRKTCRILKQKNYLMVCSNQIRQNLDAGPYGQKYISPGGESIGFYTSLRLRTFGLEKIQESILYRGVEKKEVIGINVMVEVYKSSVDKPLRKAPVTIIFDYGIDNIRQNLQFLKKYMKTTTYCIGEQKLDRSMKKSIMLVEREGLEDQLENEVIDLWEKIESKFKSERKTKKR